MSFLVCLCLSGLTLAQEVTRVVILPFDASGAAETYQLGLAAGVQRALNVIDNVYAPPIGDSTELTRRLLEQGSLSPDTVVAAYNADAVVGGQITSEDNLATIRMGFNGAAYPELKELSVSAPLDDPAQLIASVANAIINELALAVTAADRQQVNDVLSQTPSLPSLQAVSVAALGLPRVNLSDLEAAAQLDGGSSWVLTELVRARALSRDLEGAASASQAAIDASANDAEALVTRGIVLQALNDTATALQAFDAALALNPAHARALVGKASLSEGAEATGLLERATAANPRLTEAYLQLAALQDNPQRALQVLQRGATQVPDAFDLHRDFVRRAVAAGDASGALAYLQQRVADPSSRSAALYSLAALLPNEVADGALALLSEGRQAFPEEVTLALAEAELLEQSGNLAEAETVLQGLYAQDGTNARLANALAIVLAKQGKTDAAREVLTAAGGNSNAAQVNLAQLYLNAGQSQQALELLETLIQQQPDDAEVFALYGIASGRLGRYDQAYNALERALELNPDLELAVRARGLLEQQETLTGGQTFEFSQDVATEVEAGLSALEAGDYAAASDAFSRAKALEDNGFIAFYAGYSAQLDARPRDALRDYEQALAAFPDNDIVLNNLGYAYLQVGRYDLALEHLQQAVSQNAQNARAHINLGATYYALNRFDEALAQFETAVGIDSSLEANLQSLMDELRSQTSE